MSYWTYINGIIEVSPMGRTQHEKEYILKTVLDHLPLVTGSERDMNVYVIKKNGTNSSSSCDEFGENTNNLVNRYGDKDRKNGWHRLQDNYLLVVNGAFRDRMFKQTYREFQKWLCRLAKRVDVYDVLVEIKGWEQSTIIRNSNDVYGEMFECPTWSDYNKTGEPNWCEYLMWDRAKNSWYPMKLAYKYFYDEENDREVKRRLKYENG